VKAIASEKHQQLIVPYRKDVKNIIHTAKEIKWKGDTWLAVPWQPTELKLLKNLGIDVPALVMHGYDWVNVTPFDSQIKTANMLVQNSRAYVLNSLGTGKTCAALFALDYLLKAGTVSKCLVVAPLSTLNTVWARELFTRFSHISHQVIYGPKKKRVQQVAIDSTVDIINHEGVHVIQEVLLNQNYDVVIIDELASYRNARTRRWKSAKPLVGKAKFVWGLTGVPTPNEPTDAWAQCRLLTPERVSYSARAFKSQTMRQVSQFRWVNREEANYIVHAAMQPAVRFTRDQCFDLPPTTYSTRHIDLTSEQKKAYKTMMEEFAVGINNHEITAANEGVKVAKLMQIACGFAYGSMGVPSNIKSAPRFRMLLDTIEEAGGKVIVFTPFKHSVKMLAAVIGRYYSVETITGDTPTTERTRIFTAFQHSKNPKVIAAHPGCMAHGVNLQVSNTIIWFAPIWSSETYVQGNGRITRAGQTRHTHIIHFESTPVERKVYHRLKHRQKMSGLLLDMFKEGTIEG